MGKYQGLQIEGLDATAIAERIVEILTQNSLSADRMAEALVDRLVTSTSWGSSKRTMYLYTRRHRD